jgi:RHS repeat-associated protein
VNSTTTHYTLDLNAGLTQVLDESAPQGYGTTTYTYGLGRIAQTGSTTEYFLGDALGSVRQMTDQSGAITYARAYDPYGVVTQAGGTSQSAYGYTGEMSDVSGLTYLRARYYNPADGRFQSRDTWGGDVNSPMSMNRWMYVVGNPVNQVDPTGYCYTSLNFFENDWSRFWERPFLKPCRVPLGPDTGIISMPWVDEQSQEMWQQYPNSCGAAALYMFLRGEGVSVDFGTLVEQLRSERPGGYDGYCCSTGWGRFPAPTPDPLKWCNNVCVSAETLAKVAREHYGLNIQSGDNWTQK